MSHIPLVCNNLYNDNEGTWRDYAHSAGKSHILTSCPATHTHWEYVPHLQFSFIITYHSKPYSDQIIQGKYHHRNCASNNIK